MGWFVRSFCAPPRHRPSSDCPSVHSLSDHSVRDDFRLSITNCEEPAHPMFAFLSLQWGLSRSVRIYQGQDLTAGCTRLCWWLARPFPFAQMTAHVDQACSTATCSRHYIAETTKPGIKYQRPVHCHQKGVRLHCWMGLEP